MLLPMESATISLEDARLLILGIENLASNEKKEQLWPHRILSHSTRKKIAESGLGKVYNELTSFITRAEHYIGELEFFEPRSKQDRLE